MRHLAAFALTLLVATPAFAHQPPAPAAWILRGATIRTQDPHRPTATAIALAHGRILAVGTDADVARHRGPATRTLDLRGKAIVPGFHDGHVHPLTSGVELGDCSLNDLDVSKGAKQAVQALVRAYARANPRKAWIRGGGWELTWFPGGKPDKAWLDAVVPDRPVALWSTDAHTVWANSLALKLAGITARSKDPAHGRIERDARGIPQGTLREDAADLVGALVPAPTAEERRAGLARGLKALREHGITTAVEADCEKSTLETYAEADRAGWLTAKVVASLHVDPGAGPAQVTGLARLRARHAGRRLRPTAAKLFLDGVLEAQTGALLDPYTTGKQPPPMYDRARLDALVTALDAQGFQVHMHATGDAAVRAGLDAAEAALKANGSRDARHVIAHLQLVDPADLPRFRDLGVVACAQPYWAMRDDFIKDLTEPFVGPARSARFYPMGALARAGAPLALGSDWSVSSLSPLDGMAVAIARRDPATGAGPAWLPEQRLTAEEALAGYTTGGAWLARSEAETGMLRPGMAADLAVLAGDPLRVPAHRLPRDARVLMTWLDGVPIYDPKAWAAPAGRR